MRHDDLTIVALDETVSRRQDVAVGIGEVLLRPVGWPAILAPQRKANRARSKVRSAVETVFAAQKHRFGLFVRTIGLARARTKIGLANLTYNLKRFLWIETRPVAT